MYMLPLCPMPFPKVNSVPVELAEGELPFSEETNELLEGTKNSSVVDDSNTIDPIVVEGTMKSPDVED